MKTTPWTYMYACQDPECERLRPSSIDSKASNLRKCPNCGSAVTRKGRYRGRVGKVQFTITKEPS